MVFQRFSGFQFGVAFRDLPVAIPALGSPTAIMLMAISCANVRLRKADRSYQLQQSDKRLAVKVSRGKNSFWNLGGNGAPVRGLPVGRQ